MKNSTDQKLHAETSMDLPFICQHERRASISSVSCFVVVDAMQSELLDEKYKSLNVNFVDISKRKSSLSTVCAKLNLC